MFWVPNFMIWASKPMIWALMSMIWMLKSKIWVPTSRIWAPHVFNWLQHLSKLGLSRGYCLRLLRKVRIELSCRRDLTVLRLRRANMTPNLSTEALQVFILMQFEAVYQALCMHPSRTFPATTPRRYVARTGARALRYFFVLSLFLAVAPCTIPYCKRRGKETAHVSRWKHIADLQCSGAALRICRGF